MNRQFKSSAVHLFDTNADEAGSAMILDNDTILLDPTANTPLKIHQLPSSDIDKLELEAWTPPFRLTNDEKKIVQTKGTVLVLGRSGTGKVCVQVIYRTIFLSKPLMRFYPNIFLTTPFQICLLTNFSYYIYH